jgi:hypothetical protein
MSSLVVNSISDLTLATSVNVTDLATKTYVSGVIPAAATAIPSTNGTAAVGTSTKYAREDHVHAGGASGLFSTSFITYYANLTQVTVGRQGAVIYTNTSNRPRMVSLIYINYAANVYCDNINGSTNIIGYMQAGGGAPWNAYSFIVPPGWKYSLSNASSAGNFYAWSELD